MRLLLIFVIQLAIISGAMNMRLTSIFYGNQGWSMNEVDYLSSWTGKRPTVIVLFTDWCNGSMIDLFNSQLNNIWNNSGIPLITWEPFECGGASQPGIMKLVRNNVYDTYITQFGDRLRAWLAGNDGVLGNADDRRAYLRLGHEMNGNWYPWAAAMGNSIPQDYILAWQHIHDIFSNKNLDSTRLQWMWCVNNADVGNYTAEDYWVGDNYVDWIGVDGYNWGSTQSWSSWAWPNQIFDNMISRLRLLSATKPLCITEHGTTSIRTGNVSDIPAKNNWLSEFCIYMNSTQTQMAPYFNIDKETDWAIFGGMNGNTMWNNYSAYTAYKDCLQSNDWIVPNTSNPRLITDEQFAGIVLANTTASTTSTSTTSTSSTTNITTSTNSNTSTISTSPTSNTTASTSSNASTASTTSNTTFSTTSTSSTTSNSDFIRYILIGMGTIIGIGTVSAAIWAISYYCCCRKVGFLAARKRPKIHPESRRPAKSAMQNRRTFLK